MIRPVYPVLAGAAALIGTAIADIPPPEPENPLPEACKPFIGVWTRDVPQVFRSGSRWMVVAIGAENATLLVYNNDQDINYRVEALAFTLTCTPDGAGAVKLVFARENWGTVELLATPAGETTFTTTEETNYLGGGPPDPNWKPQALIVTWTRVAR
jgi:hypothetical protein